MDQNMTPITNPLSRYDFDTEKTRTKFVSIDEADGITAYDEKYVLGRSIKPAEYKDMHKCVFDDFRNNGELMQEPGFYAKRTMGNLPADINYTNLNITSEQAVKEIEDAVEKALESGNATVEIKNNIVTEKEITM